MRMRFQIARLWAVTAAAVAVPATAQIEVGCRIEQSRLVQYEPMRVTVRIQNNSGGPLHFTGADRNARLQFEIEQTPGRVLPMRQPPVLKEPFVIPPRGHATRDVILTDHYDLRSTGPYTIRARVDWEGRGFVSPKVFADMVPGFEIDRLIAAAPGAARSMRHYRLLTLNRDRGEHIFLRIDDEAEGICYGVIHLGRVIRTRKPMLRVDGDFNIHVLYQSGPGRYAHNVFSPEGRRIQRKTYMDEEQQAELSDAGDGRIIVTGASASLGDE